MFSSSSLFPKDRRLVPVSLLFLVGKCFHVFALFLAHDFLHNLTLSILNYSFILLLGSGAVFVALTRSFSQLSLLTRPTGAGKLIFLNGSLLALSFLCYTFGLKHCGPIRTILMDFCDSLLLFLPALFCGWASLSTQRRRGLMLILLAVCTLLLTQERSVHDAPKASATSIAAAKSPDSSSDPHQLSDALSHTFHFLFFDVSEGAIGMIALLFAAGLSYFGKNFEKKNSKEFGGRKRLHAVSMMAGAVIISPLVIGQYIIPASAAAQAAAAAATGEHAVSLFTCFATLLFLILFFVVLQFYVDSIGQRSDSQMLSKLSLVFSFLCAALIDWMRGEGRLSVATGVATGLIFLGTHFLTAAASRSKDSGSSLPLYSTSSASSTSFTSREFRSLIRHFMADKTSMRIFIFLCINFMFMFVELIYGFYSNSLGLISDAGHMACDNIALAIGLYASFIAKIKANHVYTYGYGRSEVISGYLNGIFLLFIGYFVFVESIERLFRPPEIRSDSLVLVSVLGLMVNMVGLVFFHDHGGHGHSHGDEERNHNVFAIYLHILADALGSVGVIISSLMVKYWNWTRADAVCSIIISFLIIASVLPLIDSTVGVLLGRTPHHKMRSMNSALQRVLEVPGVIGYRNPHLWMFSDKELIGTLHVQVDESQNEQRVMGSVRSILQSKPLGVHNLTLQVEKAATAATAIGLNLDGKSSSKL